MTEKKKSFRSLAEELKALRKRPLDPKFIEEFNKMTEEDDRREREEEEKRKKKIAKTPEADL
ncbi:MAG: hypothetical protein AB1540_17700 [Bdellovibrionota bacterium]